MAESIRKIAVRRGYMAIAIRERGNVPRNMKRAFNAASKVAWFRTGVYFHTNLRDKRFTPEHAEEAGYSMRKGQGQTPGTSAFRNSYYGRKFRAANRGGGPDQADPLVYTGRTRRAVRSSRISSTSVRGRIAYAGARVFNFRHPNSRVRMSDEFRRITPSEIIELADVYDSHLDRNLKANDN